MKRNILLSLAGLTLVAACTDTLTRPTDVADLANGRLAPRGPMLDEIANDLDAGIDAVAEEMPLNVGTNGTTVLYVSPSNGDGKNGCNLTGSTTFVVSITSSNTLVATVSPATATFTSCGDTKELTITPVSQGITTVSVTQTANNSGGTFDLAPASFSVTVAPPSNTAPQIAVAGVTGGASYSKGSVPTATCQVTDAEDGSKSFAATLSAITGTYASDGIGSQTASCSYTDGGGLTASASETYSIIDPSPPTLNYSLVKASPDGTNGWYVSDVTLTWDVADSESPNSLVKVGCEDQNIISDQQADTYKCSATSAGGTASEVSVTIKRDATAPTVSLSDGPESGASYYFGGVPAAPTCIASDATSGLDGTCAVSGYSTAVGTHTVTGAVKDKAGNLGSASLSYTVKAWTLHGFYQPVDMNGVVNTIKAGSTVPLKFEVFAGSTELTSISSVKGFSATMIACDAAAGTDEVEITSTGATVLRYDTTAGQFIQNWQTPKSAGKCYRATITTQDDSKITALFQLK